MRGAGPQEVRALQLATLATCFWDGPNPAPIAVAKRPAFFAGKLYATAMFNRREALLSERATVMRASRTMTAETLNSAGRLREHASWVCPLVQCIAPTLLFPPYMRNTLPTSAVITLICLLL